VKFGASELILSDIAIPCFRCVGGLNGFPG
jgi:hypothetical protein